MRLIEDTDEFEDWLADLYQDDPVTYETRVGEGWDRRMWYEKFCEEIYG